MFDKKYWIGVVAVFVVAMIAGLAVHGIWLDGDYAQLPNLMRPEAEAEAEGMMGFMMLAHASIALAFTWIYRVGRRDGDWLGQGLRFGLAIALVSNVPFFLIYHSVAQFPLDLTLKQCVGDTVGCLAMGLTVAFVHK